MLIVSLLHVIFWLVVRSIIIWACSAAWASLVDWLLDVYWMQRHELSLTYLIIKVTWSSDRFMMCSG
jgi:hypothetical protein